MGKNKVLYMCEECGFKSSNWMGRCTNCGAWNSFAENDDSADSKGEYSEVSRGEAVKPTSITQVKTGDYPRYFSGMDELDRVLGGGIVKGSLVLLGGAPGIGKSTLVLQAASLFSTKYNKSLYISGEESPRQIKMRAERLDLLSEDMYIMAETDFLKLNQLLIGNDEFGMVIIDSIQTIYNPKLSSEPGSILQVKGITNQLLKVAKKTETSIFLIGHITKKGDLAGPRVLEHLVDTVLRFEGDRNYTHRILRAVKNRFGSTNEIGVFTMKSSGLEEVINPSSLFLEERPKNVSGSVIVPVIEGSRTIMIELQALVSSSAFSTPRRLTTGIDKKRVSILLAVLEKKCGFNFFDRDIHLNITGGLQVEEPALDLGIVIAVLSSYKDYSLSSKLAVVGELGLAGEIRAVGQMERRIKELKKLGFTEMIIPAGNEKNIDFDPGLNIKGVKDIHQAIEIIFE
jgi:DNA repair protein RadA/Sms